MTGAPTLGAMRRRLVLGLLACACALLTAGCGGGGSATGAGAAGIVPAGVTAYVSINTDFEGEQIEQARALLDRFPGSDGALRMLEAQLEEDESIDFQQDVEPALGPSLDVVLLEVPREGEPLFVVLLQPDDPAKLDALLAKEPAGSRPVTAEVEGWTVLAENQAAIDRFEQAREGGSLEESDAFKDAMDGLADDALVRTYVDLPAVMEAVGAQTPLEGQLGGLFTAFPLGSAATAEAHGFRLEAATKTDQQTENFEPSLPSELPTGALAYVGLGNLAEGIRESLNRAGEQNPELDRQLAQLELALGLSLDEDILPLFEQESAIAVYPSEADSGVPSFLVAVKVDDEAKAVATIDRLFERGAQFMPEIPQPQPVQIGDIDAKQVELEGVTVVYAAFDGKLVATNDGDLLGEMNGDGPKLSEDATFQHASEHAELPGEVQTLMYVNLNEVPRYAFDLAERRGDPAPPQVRENVDPLDSLLLYGTQEDDRVGVSGFLALDD